MQNHKISVIIPVYNAEKTIGNILEKLISQNYRNIEIIAINDGSQDNSWKVLQKFAKKDERIITIDQKNAGASAARNVGIKEATGDFITFIDSDDDISNKLISELTSRIKNNSDFIMCGMSINKKAVVATDAFIEGRELLRRYVLKSLLTKNLLYGPYCKLFRRDIIVKYKIQFPQGVRYGEDTVFILSYLCYVDSITVIGQALYAYHFQSSGLASNNATNTKFRRTRSRALSKYLISSRISISSLFLYLFLRLRWMLATIKSQIKSLSLKGGHDAT